MLDCTEDSGDKNPENSRWDWIIGELLTIAAKNKHEGFIEENEWRIVSKFDEDGLDIDFRAGKSMLIPYKKIPLGDKIKFAKIIIGPTPHPKLSQRSFKWYLKTKNISCDKIEMTSIPYRNW